MPADLGQPCEIDAIKRLKSRYCRLLDTKRWEDFRSLFTADAHLLGQGLDAFLAQTRARLGDGATVHQVHMPVIEVTGTSARGTWALFDYNEYPSSGARLAKQGYGHYVEEYRKDGEDWKIHSLELTRLRQDALREPATGAEPPARLTADWTAGGAAPDLDQLADL